MIQCAKCGVANAVDARFCNSCGNSFPIPQPTMSTKNKSNLTAILIVVGCVFGSCVLCGIVGGIKEAINPSNKNVVQTNANNVLNQANTTPVPTATPISFEDLKKQTATLLKFEKAEYKSDDLKQFDDVLNPLKTISKDSPNYKEAQKLIKSLIDKSSVIGAEILVLGEKPNEGDLHVAFNQYLRSRLNDYDSSEYVDYTPAIKVKIKNEPFWMSILKLRAKNGFGAYVVRDIKMYLRNKKVVVADGL